MKDQAYDEAAVRILAERSAIGTVVISRHPGALAWLRADRADLVAEARVITGDATPDDVRGRIVVGNVPMALAALAAEVIAVEFAGAPPRGAEYGVDEMRAAGARTVPYQVRVACGLALAER